MEARVGRCKLQYELWNINAPKINGALICPPSQITRRGHYGLLSAGWYLNDIKYGADWVRMYDQDPQDFGGTQEEKNRVLGGEVSTRSVDILQIIEM